MRHWPIDNRALSCKIDAPAPVADEAVSLPQLVLPQLQASGSYDEALVSLMQRPDPLAGLDIATRTPDVALCAAAYLYHYSRARIREPEFH